MKGSAVRIRASALTPDSLAFIPVDRGADRAPRLSLAPQQVAAAARVGSHGLLRKDIPNRRESRRTMLRRRRLLLFSLIALAGIVPATPALAKTVPGSPPFRVVILDHMAGWQLRQFARHGAVGLLVPGAGPTTNRRQALAQLVRGRQENAQLGGVPAGQPLLSANLATGTPSHARTIIVTLPPKSYLPVPNDKRYYVVVLGGGFHGLLVSKTTRITGLVSIVDIAPTALGRRGSLTSTSSAHVVAYLKGL